MDEFEKNYDDVFILVKDDGLFTTASFKQFKYSDIPDMIDIEFRENGKETITLKKMSLGDARCIWDKLVTDGFGLPLKW